jgi:hypothetical protein
LGISVGVLSFENREKSKGSFREVKFEVVEVEKRGKLFEI